MELLEEKDTSPGKTVQALAGVAVLSTLFVVGLHDYLLFHTVTELFSIAVAFAIFMLAWNSRRYSTDNYLQVIGISYFFVGLIDLVHTMSYKGMGVFPGYDANLPTQLWVAGRYVQSLSLLAAPFLIGRKLNHIALLSVYSLAVGLVFATAFSRVFPVCYIEGTGLTPFKIASEYLISLFFVLSIALLLRAKRHFEAHVVRLMVWSMAFAVGGEIALTFYRAVYGIFNMIGHFFKIISFYFVYRAIVVTGLMRPYDLLFKSLKQSEANLREYQEHLEELVGKRTLELKRANEDLLKEIAERKRTEEVLVDQSKLLDSFFTHTINPLVFLDKDFNFLQVNGAYARACKRKESDFIGHNHFEFYPHEENEAIFRRVVETKESFEATAKPFVFPDHPEWGVTYWDWALVPILDDKGEVDFLVFSLNDVTDRKKAEDRLVYSNTLLKLLSKVSLRKEYLAAVTKLVRNWSGCRCVGIRVLNEDKSIPYESYVGFSKEFWESENWLSVERDHCVCIRVITGKLESQDAPAVTPFGSFRSDNTFKFVAGLSEQEKSSFRGVCVRSGFASVAVVPVKYGGEIVAAVHLADEREGMVSREFIEFFESMTPLIGEAIHK
ncbi:MAG TPA: MASE3 domain-containing protein, partial [Dissulfurispiraceae bacterium]